MLTFPRPSARLRRAMAFVPIFAALVSAHPRDLRPREEHRHPLPPAACLEAGALAFGPVQVGARQTDSLPVANRCAHAITLWKIAGGSRAFTSDFKGSLRLPPRGKGTVPLSFSPADTGAAEAFFTLYAEPPSSRVRIRVTGTGIAPAPTASVSVSPASFRIAMDPARTDTLRLSVTNHGTAPRAEILVDAIGDPLPRPERGWRVLYLNTSMTGPWDDGLMSLMRPLPNVDTVAAWFGGDSLPSLSRMLEYDIVVVVSMLAWKDSVAAGDLLADYLEAGGKVLLTASTMENGIHPLYGRIQDYAPVGKGSATYLDTSSSLAAHPITAGVGQFAAGDILDVSSTKGEGAGIPLGTYSRGALVGAYHPDKPLLFLNINSYYLYGDIPRLLGNAFDYLGSMMAWMTPRPPFDPVIFVVPDGETRELKVAVNSYRLGAGSHAGAIRLLNASDPDAVPIDVPVSLTVSSFRSLAVDPASLDFGPTWQGSRATRAVRLVNTGSATTHVSGFSQGGAFSLAATLPLEIPPFSSALVQASFAPAETGEDSAEILVNSDAQDAASAKIGLQGRGIVPPILSVSPRGFDVTLAEGDTTDEPLYIRNPGGDSLRLTLRAVVDSAAGVHPTGPEKLRVLYLQTTGQSYSSETDFFMWDVLGDPRVDTLVGFSGSDSTPSLAYLRQFDAVLVAASAGWADSETVGNRLADYVDAGGKLILMDGALFPMSIGDTHSPGLGGRILSPEYSPMAAGNGIADNFAERVADLPIMEGLANNLESDWAMNVTSTQGGGIPLGWYSNGALIGAYNPRKPVVFLNIFPLDGYNYPPGTVRLIGNSLRFLSEFYNWMQPTRRTLTLGPGEEVSLPIRFGADYGLSAGTYTGRLNVYHNDPAAGNPLVIPATLTVQPGSQAAAAR